MFLNLLTPKEKIAFLALAEKLIKSDETIEASEMILLKAMQREMEIMEELMDKEIREEDIENLSEDIEVICKEFTSKKSKVSVLMELIGLGFVDGIFLPQERDFIYLIAHHFEISKLEADNYIDWASKIYHE